MNESCLLLVERAVKTARDPGGDRYAARTTTHVTWTVSGPFARRATAERAAVLALGTHSALSVRILTLAEARAMLEPPACHDAEYGVLRLLRAFLRTMSADVSAG